MFQPGFTTCFPKRALRLEVFRVFPHQETDPQHVGMCPMPLAHGSKLPSRGPSAPHCLNNSQQSNDSPELVAWENPSTKSWHLGRSELQEIKCPSQNPKHTQTLERERERVPSTVQQTLSQQVSLSKLVRTRRIHVWVYLPTFTSLPSKSTIHVGKYAKVPWILWDI